MMKIGIKTLTDAIIALWRHYDIPGPDPYVECFHMVTENRIRIRVGSDKFLSIADFVDAAWERNVY